MFLPNSEEYALKKIDLQKQKKAVERDYEEFVSDTIATLPVKQRDVIKLGNGNVYQIQNVRIPKSDLQILVESLEEKLCVGLNGIKQYANKKDWTKAGMIPKSGIVEKNGKPNTIECEFLPNSKEFLFRKIEFQKQVAAIEKEFERLHTEVMKTFPIQVNDLVKHGSATYKITRIELMDKLDWKVELLNEISVPTTYNLSLRVFGQRRVKLNEWSEKATELEGSKIFQVNGKWVDPFKLGVALKPIATKNGTVALHSIF